MFKHPFLHEQQMNERIEQKCKIMINKALSLVVNQNLLWTIYLFSN